MRADGVKHRELMARRSREKSLAARDIAPLPPIRNPKRRKAARESLRAFCETYFPEKFKLAWSSYHLEVIDRLETIITKGGKLALAMPRGSGKTTITMVAAIWALLNAYRRYLVIVAANQKEAKNILDSIKTAFSNNKRLLEDYPEIVYPVVKLNGSALLARGQLYIGCLTNMTWTALGLTLPTIAGSKAAGSQVITSGLFGTIRGKNTEMPDGSTERPDLVLIDDPQTDALAKSPTQIAKAEEVINKAIGGLAGPGKNLAIAMPCTVIQEGDLADRYLNRKLYPQWGGLRFKMIEKMPDRMELWEEYREIRRDDCDKATRFYKKNRKAMQEGAVVAWKANYTADEMDALQYAMNLWADDYSAFMSERQNEPLRPDLGTIVTPAKTIRSRLNGLDPLMIPLDAARLTGFIDVHDDLLYYAAVAWADDFTGCIVDYGTYPKQTRRMFAKADKGLKTLQTVYKGLSTNAAIQAGLTALIKDLLAISWDVQGDEDGGEIVRFGRILIDSGYKPDLVENAIRLVGSPVVSPSKGKGIRASGMPIAEWAKNKGRMFGQYWIEDRPRNRKERTITLDTNYWKCRVHEAFFLSPGDRGGLALWGHEPETHRMFSEHHNAEIGTLVESSQNKVVEWQTIPGRDNHFFDCLVGNMVAASHLGIKPIEEQAARPVKRRRSIA